MNATPFAALALLCAVCSVAAANEASEPAATGRRAEPKVQRTVIEDEGSRIEELRVRGQTQRISVQPKGAIKQRYEIIPADAGRDMSESAGAEPRGAAGKRVWRVLDF